MLFSAFAEFLGSVPSQILQQSEIQIFSDMWGVIAMVENELQLVTRPT